MFGIWEEEWTGWGERTGERGGESPELDEEEDEEENGDFERGLDSWMVERMFGWVMA